MNIKKATESLSSSMEDNKWVCPTADSKAALDLSRSAKVLRGLFR
jgi:hypothetical protein